MGYHTEFEGALSIEPSLKSEHIQYLQKFSETRRMKRNESKAKLLDDIIRGITDLPVGRYGEYFVGGGGWAGQGDDDSVLDYNSPPPSQPGLWCSWTVNDDGTFLEWDGKEKFYDYVDWLQYIISHFMKRWGYTLNGKIDYRGEDFYDNGTISVEDNVITVIRRR